MQCSIIGWMGRVEIALSWVIINQSTLLWNLFSSIQVLGSRCG